MALGAGAKDSDGVWGGRKTPNLLSSPPPLFSPQQPFIPPPPRGSLRNTIPSSRFDRALVVLYRHSAPECGHVVPPKVLDVFRPPFGSIPTRRHRVNPTWMAGLAGTPSAPLNNIYATFASCALVVEVLDVPRFNHRNGSGTRAAPSVMCRGHMAALS